MKKEIGLEHGLMTPRGAQQGQVFVRLYVGATARKAVHLWEWGVKTSGLEVPLSTVVLSRRVGFMEKLRNLTQGEPLLELTVEGTRG